MYKILDAVHSYCICTLVLKMNTNHETHQGQQTRYWEQRQAWQQLLNNIHQSQQLVDHWEMFVRVICFQLLTAVVLLLWETAFSSSHMHRERKMWCAKPLWEDCSIELIYWMVWRIFSFLPVDAAPLSVNRLWPSSQPLYITHAHKCDSDHA